MSLNVFDLALTLFVSVWAPPHLTYGLRQRRTYFYFIIKQVALQPSKFLWSVNSRLLDDKTKTKIHSNGLPCPFAHHCSKLEDYLRYQVCLSYFCLHLRTIVASKLKMICHRSNQIAIGYLFVLQLPLAKPFRPTPGERLQLILLIPASFHSTLRLHPRAQDKRLFLSLLSNTRRSASAIPA